MKKRGVRRATKRSRISRDKDEDGKTIVRRRSKDSRRKRKGLKRKYPLGRHPNQKKHWWKPGKSAHPEGRPRKEHSITSLMKAYLEQVVDDKTGMTREALLAKAVVSGALDMNKTALKEVLSRVDGAVKQHLTVDGKQNVEISIGDLTRELAKRKRKRKIKKEDWWKPKGRKARKRLEKVN